jgi:hypothetical protein
MLGSVHDADDAVQESLLRAWKAVGRFDGLQSVRPWLYSGCCDDIAGAVTTLVSAVAQRDYYDRRPRQGLDLLERIAQSLRSA